MGGTAPANQPRLSFTGSEDGEAENGSLQNGEALVANDDSTLRPARAQLAEPPYADSPVQWCGRGEQVPAPPIPICERCWGIGNGVARHCPHLRELNKIRDSA